MFSRLSVLSCSTGEFKTFYINVEFFTSFSKQLFSFNSLFWNSFCLSATHYWTFVFGRLLILWDSSSKLSSLNENGFLNKCCKLYSKSLNYYSIWFDQVRGINEFEKQYVNTLLLIGNIIFWWTKIELLMFFFCFRATLQIKHVIIVSFIFIYCIFSFY